MCQWCGVCSSAALAVSFVCLSCVCVGGVWIYSYLFADHTLNHAIHTTTTANTKQHIELQHITTPHTHSTHSVLHTPPMCLHSLQLLLHCGCVGVDGSDFVCECVCTVVLVVCFGPVDVLDE